MVQWYKTRLEVGIFLRGNKTTSKRDADQRKDLKQVQDGLYVWTQRTCLSSYMFYVKPIFCKHVYKHCNCIQVPKNLGRNILNIRGLRFTFSVSQLRFIKGIRAASSHEACLFLILRLCCLIFVQIG